MRSCPDLSYMILHLTGKGKRIERLELFGQCALFLLNDSWRTQKSLEGCVRPIMPSDEFLSDTFFMYLLHRRHEEVDHQSQLTTVERVHRCDHAMIVKTVIAEVLANDVPVFLFDMGVIVRVVWTSSRKLHLAMTLVEILVQLPVDELGTVIAIEPQLPTADSLGGEISIDRGGRDAAQQVLRYLRERIAIGQTIMGKPEWNHTPQSFSAWQIRFLPEFYQKRVHQRIVIHLGTAPWAVGRAAGWSTIPDGLVMKCDRVFTRISAGLADFIQEFRTLFAVRFLGTCAHDVHILFA